MNSYEHTHNYNIDTCIMFIVYNPIIGVFEIKEVYACICKDLKAATLGHIAISDLVIPPINTLFTTELFSGIYEV